MLHGCIISVYCNLLKRIEKLKQQQGKFSCKKNPEQKLRDVRLLLAVLIKTEFNYILDFEPICY